MPNNGEKISLDFDGNALIEIYNDNSKLRLTGNAINGYGCHIEVMPTEITFTKDKQ
ncbi:MAG: hypothetical protein WC179_05020 [Candidatus Cloacimonadaceae bacterium]